MKMFFLYGCSYPSKMSCIILKFLWVLAKGKCESNWHLSFCQALSFSSLYRFQLCQAISCSGLCFIATSCAQYLPVNAIKFVLLALKAVLKIVGNPSKCSNAFVYQVALDGLAKLLTNPSTWNVLSVLERQDTVETYLTIFLNQCLVDDIVVDDPTTAMMLEVFDNSNVLDILLSSPRQAILGKLLKQLLRLLPPITSSDGKSKVNSPLCLPYLKRTKCTK